MLSARWQEIKDVLHQALQLPAEERSAFIHRVCTDDSMRCELESLLSSSEEARSSFLESTTLNAMLTAGTKIGDYEVVAFIGAGGMGKIYRAHDPRLRRDVAIKLLPSFLEHDPDRLQRFEQEARAAAALNHPNILSVFQMGTYQGVPYLVSELLEGTTLREQFVRGPLPVRKAIEYGVQIAHGLAAAHKKSIVHRDLKPENLFVTKDGRVKILDFGLAKLTQSPSNPARNPPTMGTETGPGVVMGTVGYMSPEQVRGQAVDNRTDIFAFGAILYEMLSGKRAFQKPTSADTMSAILNEDPVGISQLVPSTPPALERVVHRCLEKSPEQRFQSASDLGFALEALSDSGTANAIAKATKSRPNLKWIAVATLAMAASAAAVVVWWNLPHGVPVITAITQLTHDGVPKPRGRVVTDGSRLYFNEGATGALKIAQVAVAGGETSMVETRLINPHLLALSSDGSSLLAMVGGSNLNHPAVYPLWSIPLPSGEPRRLGSIEAQGGDFLPDGRVVFAKGNELYLADKDGSNVRKLLATPRDVWCPAASPDGKSVVFANLDDARQTLNSLLETTLSGELQTLVTSSPGTILGCGRWTPDHQYFLFRLSRSARSSDIWALPGQSGFLHHRHQAIQLTSGPVAYLGPIPSRDGKRIFTVGTQARGELVRYDIKKKEFLPFLSGVSAIDPTFSRDGKWVAYTAYPDHTLWRSRVDGTDRLELTYPPMMVAWPVISPDGKQVALAAFNEVYVVSTDGGVPRKIVDKPAVARFSPDSSSLVINVWTGKQWGQRNAWELRIFDLRSGNFSVVPSSQNIVGPWWLDDNTLVGADEDTTKLMRFDFKSGKWSELVSGALVNWAPSLDSKYMYYTTGGTEPKAKRIRLADRNIEELTSLKHLQRVVDTVDGGPSISVAPDGSPVFTRDIGPQEIYALDVKWP